MDVFTQIAQQVARQAQEAARLAAVQAEEWRQATPSERTFMGLGTFRSWLAGGGEARAGLPRGTLTPLYQNVSRFCATGKELLQELEEIEQDWKDVQGDNSMKAALGRLVINLSEAGQLGSEAMSHAGEIKIEANVAYGVIERNMKEDHRAIQGADAAIQTGERNIATARKKLKAAKEKLEGWEGFGNGFLTAITFTAHNPIKASINEQRSAIKTINQRIASNILLRDQRRQHASELSAGQQRAINMDFIFDEDLDLEFITEEGDERSAFTLVNATPEAAAFAKAYETDVELHKMAVAERRQQMDKLEKGAKNRRRRRQGRQRHL